MSDTTAWREIRDGMAAMSDRAYRAEFERGRRECEATHDELAGSCFDSGYEQGHADAVRGIRTGLLLSLGLWLALWAAWLARHAGDQP